MTTLSTANATRLLALFLLVITGTCLSDSESKVSLAERHQRRFKNSLQRGCGDGALKEQQHDVVSLTPRCGGGDASSSTTTTTTTTRFAWFKPGASKREKQLALFLLLWNSMALMDALMFTFRPSRNLDCYLIGEWGRHALAQTRMLSNCQLALIACVTLLAWTGNERTLKNTFKIMIAATLGAFRAVSVGVQEGSIRAPWKSGYAALMTLPPLLLLSYFAFVF